MHLLNSLRKIVSRATAHHRGPRRLPGHHPRNRRLEIEALEDRTLPSCTLSLVPNEAAPQLVGERITWTATASDCGSAAVYQFSAAPHGGTFHVVRDFSPGNTFVWTPMQEGTYDIQVTVKDGYQATETTSAVVSDAVASRVTGSQAVITATLNPLVALYSVPPSAAATVFVQFSAAGDDPSWRNTNALPTVPGKSTNVFVAGMLPNTTYQMRHVFSDGTGSSPLLFTTGSIPSTLTFPTFTVRQPPGPGSDPNLDLVLHLSRGSSANSPGRVATDLMGRVVWYYDPRQAGLSDIGPGFGIVSGGTMLVGGNDSAGRVLREIDLAGNPLRETNVAAMNAQLTALGHDIIYDFHHDGQRLPNGHTAVIGYTFRTVSIGGTPTDYVGDMIVVLDENFQVAWAWEAFDHLDVNRGPVLGERVGGVAALIGLFPDHPEALDWTHSNAVAWSPADGNLILSIRNQNWVVKVDYRNGSGDGHIVWRLGRDGDFTALSTDPYPWFSNQHNAHYLDATTLVLFDNGNTRLVSDPDGHSRGQVWTLDEQTLTAIPVLNADLGVFSGAVGAAQRLSNGNYSFTAGQLGPPASRFGQTIEVLPDGTIVYVLEMARQEYRSYRLRTFYEGIDEALAGAPQKVNSVVLNDGSAQRSMVTRITVTFSGVAILDPGAFELRRQDGSLVGLNISTSAVDGRTIAVLTFTGPGILAGSLADGNYTLTVQADRVHDRWGRELDGDGNDSPGGDRTDAFFRLYGDSDGDRDVDLLDLGRFLSTFGRRRGDPHYLAYLDFNGDDRVGLLDLFAFAGRLGTALSP